MHKTNYPSITKFQELVELKDYRKPTKKEYVRYVHRPGRMPLCEGNFPAKTSADCLPAMDPAQTKALECSCREAAQSNQAASGNGAIPSLFHIKILGRAVPEKL